MPIVSGLHTTHKEQHIEWACTKCTQDNEGHVAATMIAHAEDVHPDRQMLMVGKIPCPVAECHSVFSWASVLWHHLAEHHPGLPECGVSQASMLLLPMDEATPEHLAAIFDIPGHGSRRGKPSHHEKPHPYSTHSSSIKNHGRTKGKPLTIDTQNLSRSHPQSPGPWPGSSGNDIPFSEDHVASLRNGDWHATSGNFIPTSGDSPRSPGYGSGFTSHETSGSPYADDFHHPSLYGPKGSIYQGHQEDKGHHTVGRPHGTDAHTVHGAAKPKCAGCHEELTEGIMMHVEQSTKHRDIFSCWHCGAMFGKKSKELLDHVHKKHADESRDQKLPCAHAGCHETCYNPWHQRQHLTIDHHEKRAQQDISNSLLPGSKDHSKSEGQPKDSQGHGKGKDHNKDKDLDKSLGQGKEKDHIKPEGLGKDSQDHEKGKNHAKSEGHEKESQIYAKEKEKDYAKTVQLSGKGSKSQGREKDEDGWIDVKGGAKDKSTKKPSALFKRKVGTARSKPGRLGMSSLRGKK